MQHKILSNDPENRCFRIKSEKPAKLRIAKREAIICTKDIEADTVIQYSDLTLEGVRLYGRFNIMVDYMTQTGNWLRADQMEIRVDPPIPEYQWHDCGNLIGTNYTCASSSNQIEFWLRYPEFRDEIEGELSSAQAAGINILRVFLHNRVFEKAPGQFLENMENFNAQCASHEIKLLYVFFDDCWYGDESVTTDFEPVKGKHNGRWAKCPLFADRTVANYPRFHDYIVSVIHNFRDDSRIWGWEIWNEPKNYVMPGRVDTEFTDDLMACGFGWAREEAPSQLLVSCWDGSRYGDVDDIHNYVMRGPKEYPNGVGCSVDLRRGSIVTEAGSRTWKDHGYGSPIHWIWWLEQQKKAGNPVPGVFLNWELMAGNSNCAWHWSSPEGEHYPGVPWCGFFTGNNMPIHVGEIAAMRRYAGKEHGILLLKGFEDDGDLAGCTGTKPENFSVVNDGGHGELVHTGNEPDTVEFPEKICQNYTIQSFFRIEENAACSLLLSEDGTGKTALEIFIRSDCIAAENECGRMHESRVVYTGEMHNLKIVCSDEKTEVYLDNLDQPVFCTASVAEKNCHVALRAYGAVEFDDLAAVKAPFDRK